MTTLTTPTPTTQLTSWTPPPWTETIATDGDLIECSRTLGTVPGPTGSSDRLTVSLVQYDEVRATAHHVDVVRHPAAVHVGGVSLTPDDSHTLATLLTSASALIADRDQRTKE